MAYRDDREPLRSRRDALFTRLTALELRDDGDAETERRALVRELDSVAARLTALAAPKRLPLLASLRVRTPCPAKWETMLGTDRVRHCGVCDKEVWNLDALDPDEAEAFLAERRASLPCLRVVVRTDGRVQDGACAAARTRLVRASATALALGLVTAGALLVASTTPAHSPSGCRVRHGEPVMGEAEVAPRAHPAPLELDGLMERLPATSAPHEESWPPPAARPVGLGFVGS